MVKDARKAPVDTERVELKDRYEGWYFEARMNPKIKTLKKVSSGDFDLMMEGLGEIIVKWNFVDENGESLGEPSPDSVQEMSSDLATMVAQQYVEKLNTVDPNSKSPS